MYYEASPTHPVISIHLPQSSASNQSQLWTSVLASQQLISQRKMKLIIIWENCKEVKHTIQTESNTAAEDKSAECECVTGKTLLFEP